jgi:hypothetical protein
LDFLNESGVGVERGKNRRISRLTPDFCSTEGQALGIPTRDLKSRKEKGSAGG